MECVATLDTVGLWSYIHALASLPWRREQPPSYQGMRVHDDALPLVHNASVMVDGLASHGRNVRRRDGRRYALGRLRAKTFRRPRLRRLCSDFNLGQTRRARELVRECRALR